MKFYTTYMTDSKKIFSVCLAVWLIFFHRQIFRGGYTGWDTHDLLWVNFLYFSDSLKQGYVPLWNHFIQGGVFFPTFNNIGLFSPFQLFFVLLGWIINPAYSFELMIQVTVLLGGIGAYKLFRFDGCSCSLSLFGATAFVMAVLIPLTGQLPMVVSLSSFPWLIWGLQRTMLKPFKSMLGCISWGTLATMWLSSGYLWMNLINLALAIVFWLVVYAPKFGSLAVKERSLFFDGTRCLVGSLLFLVLAYACVLLPGYLNMQLNYGDFHGDYVSPEPRLRSMNSIGFAGYPNFFIALLSLIDPRVLVNSGKYADLPKWTVGTGWVTWILFVFTVSFKNKPKQIFWIIVLLTSLFYSLESKNIVSNFLKLIPILNANRWLLLGLAYSSIFIIFYTIKQFEILKKGNAEYRYNVKVVYCFNMVSFGVVLYFKAPAPVFLILAISSCVTYFLVTSSKLKKEELLIPCLTLVNILSFAHSFYVTPIGPSYSIVEPLNGKINYSQRVLSRDKNVVITNNFRQPGEGSTYVFDDESWPLRKIPQAHGYNNLGNPYFWYVKNTNFVADFVSVTQEVRPENQTSRRDYFSDREFAQATMGDAQVDMSWPTLSSQEDATKAKRTDFQWVLKDLKISPNVAAFQVELNSDAYLMFKNVSQPDWEVFVDGVHQPLIKANRIFQSVYLRTPGEHYVEFKFKPRLTIFLLLVPYMLLLVAGILLLVRVVDQKRRLM